MKACEVKLLVILYNYDSKIFYKVAQENKDASNTTLNIIEACHKIDDQ